MENTHQSNLLYLQLNLDHFQNHYHPGKTTFLTAGTTPIQVPCEEDETAAAVFDVNSPQCFEVVRLDQEFDSFCWMKVRLDVGKHFLFYVSQFEEEVGNIFRQGCVYA